MQPRHTSHSAIAPLPNPSRGIRTHVGGSISITATFGSNSKAINHSYDANGNLTQLTTELTTPNQTGTALANPYNNQHYSYDAQNRLTAVQDNQGNLIASYQYDPYGQRIRKTIHRSLITDSNNPNVGTWQALSTPNSFSYFYRDEGLSALTFLARHPREP